MTVELYTPWSDQKYRCRLGTGQWLGSGWWGRGFTKNLEGEIDGKEVNIRVPKLGLLMLSEGTWPE